MAFRNHVAANAGGDSHSLLQSFSSEISYNQLTGEFDDVLSHWAGLGYYARGRNLHRAAKIICDDYSGDLPANKEQLLTLPGIGRSTAGAIMALAFKQHDAILDGNVKRVLCRFYAVNGWPGESAVEKQLWQLAATMRYLSGSIRVSCQETGITGQISRPQTEKNYPLA